MTIGIDYDATIAVDGEGSFTLSGSRAWSRYGMPVRLRWQLCASGGRSCFASRAATALPTCGCSGRWRVVLRRRGSDVDFLVSLDEGRSLLDLGGLLMDLRDALGCDVDVVTDTGLRERIRVDVPVTAAPL